MEQQNLNNQMPETPPAGRNPRLFLVLEIVAAVIVIALLGWLVLRPTAEAPSPSLSPSPVLSPEAQAPADLKANLESIETIDLDQEFQNIDKDLNSL